MVIDPATTPIPEIYRHLTAAITPRPIAWVSSLSAQGVANLAPFSFFNGVGANPPAVMFSPVNRRDGSRKDTILNIEATREFVINIVPEALAAVMNQTSAEYPSEISEFAACHLTQVPSRIVKPPRLQESPVHFECVLHQIVRVGDGPLSANIVIGRVVMIHANDDVLDPAGQIDPDRVQTVGRMGAILYSRTKDRFELARPNAPSR